MARLLNSIAEQSFTDFEIVISDDSPNEEVEQLISRQHAELPIAYHKNHPALGTPANWNKALSLASGEWLKLMHADDWFASKDSLLHFHHQCKKASADSVFFSAYQNVSDHAEQVERKNLHLWGRLLLRLSPYNLFHRVYVGNPSCVLMHRSVELRYDNRLKFVVDFEFYIRLMRNGFKLKYIDAILVNVGYHPQQVTHYTKYDATVQLHENNLLLMQYGAGILRNPLVYDYYWRMLRNVGIRSVEQALEIEARLHPALKKMIAKQSSISAATLQNGLLNKWHTAWSYLLP